MIRIPQNITELVTYMPGKRADEIAVEKKLTAIANYLQMKILRVPRLKL